MARDSTQSRLSSLLSVNHFKLGGIGSNSAGPDDDVRPTSRGLRARSRSRSRESRSRESRSREPRSASRSSVSPHLSGESRGLRMSRSSTALSSMEHEHPHRMSTFISDHSRLPSLPYANHGRPPPLPGQAFGGGDLGSPLEPPPRIGTYPERSSSGGGSMPGSRSASRTRPESSHGGSVGGSIPDSRPMSRVGSSHGQGEWMNLQNPTESNRLSKKKSWLPGKSHARAASETSVAHLAPTFAFVVSPNGKTPYDTNLMVAEKPVSEIWDDQGDLFVHLYDKATSQGPSFRLKAETISSSRNFMGQSSAPYANKHAPEKRSHMRNMSLGTPSPNGSRPASQAMSRSSSGGSTNEEGNTASATYLEEQPDGLHLYLQLRILKNAAGAVSSDGLERLIRIRNLFAFMVGQVLVGTPTQTTLFAIFYNLAGSLRQYEFMNMDGSSLGETAVASFLGYAEDLRLADVRSSREKTMEAIVLGERMKCWPLYNEGYVHAVGKYTELMHLKTPVLSYMSDKTRERLEKSARSLELRLKSMKQRLEAFEFPALFAGVLASSATIKAIDVKAWRAGFVGMRKHTLNVLKARYGSWPPKAKSKKNDFEGSGLNRVVTQEMYSDLSDLYDMLVDRTSLTTRSVDGHDVSASDHENPAVLHLRKFMSEFDRSSPPVLPPIPFDIPLLPQMEAVRRDFARLNVRKQVKERSKKAKDDEINMALMASYNRDSVKATPFLEAFMAFERSNAHGKTFDEMIDARIGQWIFLYVIIQCLPLLATDAPDLRWTQGVEYFLCEVPKGNPPWIKDDPSAKKYYSVAGGAGVVSLPADVVDHGVEGTYFRSHCWTAAAKWNQPEPQIEAPYSAGLALSAKHPSTSSRASSKSRSTNNAAFNNPFSPADLAPPPHHGFGGGDDRSGRMDRSGSRPGSSAGGRSLSAHGGVRSSMALGLEALPMPPSLVDPDRHARRLSTPDPNKSFDSILGLPSSLGEKKRRGK